MSSKVDPALGGRVTPMEKALSMTETATNSPKNSPAEFKRRNSRSMMVQNFKFSAALDAAESGAAEDVDVWEETRLKVKKFMKNSKIGQTYENIMLVLSVLSLLEYIYESYLNYSEPVDRAQLNSLEEIELAVAILFGLDWCLNLFLADHKLPFVTSFFSMVDLFSVIPIFATYGRDLPDVRKVNTLKSALLYAMFGLGTTRMLRALRVRRKLVNIEDAVDRYLGEICVNISVMILFFTAVMGFIEYEYQDLDFHTWVWYIWVTISTVGYGDISPLTTQGRIAAMCIIGFSIISIPKMTNELIEKMALQSVYARAVYTPKTGRSTHVVVCGDLSSTSMNDFFGELFHEDHDNTDLKAVILLPEPPTKEMIFLMRDSQYFLVLTYLQGSALLDADLKRAKAESANAIFIMTNKFSSVPDEEDAKSILLNLSIKRYLSFFDVPPKLYCMQLIRPQNRRHLNRAGDNSKAESDLVVCLNEIKMGVLAKAVMFPGANTLLMNLISSFADDPDAEVKDSKDRVGGAVAVDGSSGSGKNQNPTFKNDISWEQEYEKGCDWEIYTTTLSTMFEGAKFSELSYALYEKIGVVLFALQITENKPAGQSKLLLNPADYIIPSQGEYLIEAFVIAQNKASSDLSFNSSGPPNMDVNITALNRMRNINTFMVSAGSEVRRRSSILDHSGPKRLSHEEIRARNTLILEDQRRVEEERRADEQAKKKTSKWKSLKRSALLEKKVESFSKQEIMSQLEDQHSLQNYYLRESPVDIADVFIRTNVTEEIPFINNHTIIVGKGLKNLNDLIRPLRAKYLGPLRFIVLLTPIDIPHDVWTRIAMFDAILVVRGSPLEENNLRRAGIFRANQVVVLADGNAESKSASGMEALVDSDAIFSYQCVKRMNPHAQVVVEIVNTSNISYLDDDSNLSNTDDYKFSTQFAAGTLFTTSLLDSIVCQAYYNPSIIKVMNKLLSGVDQIDSAELAAEATARAEAMKSGQLLPSGSAADIKVNNTNGSDSEDEDGDGDTFNINSTPALKAAAKSSPTVKKFNKSPIADIEGSCLYQMKIPENLEKNTYGKLFQHLALQGIVPLGILRGTFAGMNYGPRHNRMPYCYTNPEKETELYKCDRVFVLSTKPIQLVQKLDVKDWILDLQMQRSKDKGPSGNGTLTRKSRSASNMATLESLDIHQKKLEARVGKLAGDMSKKMTQMMKMVEQLASSTSYLGTLAEGDSHAANRFEAGKLGNRGRGDSTNSMASLTGESEHEGDGSDKYTRGRKYSVETADSMLTTRTEQSNGNEQSVDNTPRSRRSSVGSVEAPTVPTTPTSILRRNNNNGSGGTTGAAADELQQAKKRSSFSDPVVASVNVIDQQKSVSPSSDARADPTQAAHLARAQYEREQINNGGKGSSSNGLKQQSIASNGTTAQGSVSEEDDSLHSKEEEQKSIGANAEGLAVSMAPSQRSAVTASDINFMSNSQSADGVDFSLGIVDTDTDLQDSPRMHVKIKPDANAHDRAGGARSAGSSPSSKNRPGWTGGLMGGGSGKFARTAPEPVAGPPVSLTESPVQPERMAKIRALSASGSRRYGGAEASPLTVDTGASPLREKQNGNSNKWID